MSRIALSADQNVATTAVTLEEQSRSWLSLINRYADAPRQVAYYERFVATFRFFARWRIAPFDVAAALCFEELRSARIRVASTDLKIAAICLVQNATRLSRNLRDFLQVPGLRVENWLDA